MKSTRMTLARILAREFENREPDLADIKELVDMQLVLDNAQDAMEQAIKDEVQNEAFNVLAPLAKKLEDDERAATAQFWADFEARKKAASV